MAYEFHGSNHSSSLTDGDEAGFIVELTRHLEDCMLHEDDDDDDDDDDNHKNTHVTCFVNQNPNQERVNSKQGRWKKTKSTQQMMYSRGRSLTSSGSGMRAVFLNRPGSQGGYNGTGVFLPPSANGPTTHSRKISGCSTALVPTRVIEVLEQHFNNLKSLSPLNNLHKTEWSHQGLKIDIQQKSRSRSTSVDNVEKKLPQEWTY